MPKNNAKKKYFECQNCGAQYPKWQGQCDFCGKWNTLEEIIFSENLANSTINASSNINVLNIKDIDNLKLNRIKTGLNEFDRVLGGGFLNGQSVLLAGEPGVGKSTLLLQVANKLNMPVYYICGEESPSQVKERYTRLHLKSDSIELWENTFVETITSYLSKRGEGLIIFDSINSGFSSRYKATQGSLSQIKEVSQQLVLFAKKSGLPIILVGQINKEGGIAGPKALEHLVDTVLFLEGDDVHSFRVLRSQKNRFGSVNEVGLFLMDEQGMTQVENPSEFLLSGRVEGASGSAVSLINEGTRCYAVEIQALVNKSSFGYPKRTSIGYSLNRLNLLIAVLSKRTKYDLNDYDVYLNIASGIKVSEPAIDLAVCASLASALKDKPLPKNSAYIGEVGLSGEIRPVKMQKRRQKEAKNVGITKLFDPTKYKNINEVLNL